MDNENKKENPVKSPRGFGGRGPGMRGTGEKARDFKSAISRLFKELKSYKAIIIIAIILAVGSSILSILAPNRLSDLTDEVQAGLVINKENMQELAGKITSKLSLGKELEDIEMNGKIITASEQYEFISLISSLGDITNSENLDVQELYAKIDEMPESIKEIIKPSINIDAVKTIIITLAALYICSAIFSYIQSVCMANVSNKFAKQLRTRISSKINKLPLKYFDRHQIRRYFIKSYKRC